MAHAQRAEAADDEAQNSSSSRPVKTFKQGGVEVSVWRNHGDKGDMYNATIRKSYKDEASGEWKDTTSFTQRISLYFPSCRRRPFRLLLS